MIPESKTTRLPSRLMRALASKNLKRFAVTMAVLILIGWIGRNAFGRYVATSIGSRVLAIRLEIRSVEIGWNQISVNDLAVYEPNVANAKQLTVKRVTVVPSIVRGFQTGVWLSKITVIEPKANVRFDADGNLLSVFPVAADNSESDDPFNIPVSQIVVKNAALMLHQTGRDSLLVPNVNLELLASDRIKVVVVIPDLFGGQLEVQSDVDAVTLAGATAVSLDNVRLDSTQLARLPLVPAVVADERVTANCGFRLVASHPANEFDLRKHTMEIRGWTTNVHADRFATLCRRIDLVASNNDGRATLTVTANPLAGEFTCSNSVDLMAAAPELKIETSLKIRRLDSLSSTFPDLEKIRTNTSASLRGSVVLNDGKLQFRGDAMADITDSSFDDVLLPVIHASVHSKGSFAIAASTNDLASDTGAIKGTVTGTMICEPYDLATLAQSLGLPPTTGIVSVKSEFLVPLESVLDRRTYIASAKIDTIGVGVSDLRMDDAVVEASLRDNLASLNVSGFNIRDENHSLLIQLNSNTVVGLNPGGEVRSQSQFFAQPTLGIVRLLGIESLDPGGRILATVSTTCPTDFVASPQSWRAETRLQTQALSALGETISDIDWKLQLADGNVTCNPLQAKWRDHTLSFDASGTVGSTVSVEGAASLDAVRIAELSEILSRYSTTKLPADGLANVQGSFSFQKDLQSGEPTFKASGSANLTQASYALTRIGEANLRWAANQHGLALATSSPDFFGGRFEVLASMRELDWTSTEIEGKFDGVEASRLIAMTGQMLPTDGTLNGGFRLTSIASVESLTGDAWLGSQQLSVKRLPVNIDQATIGIDRGELSVKATGTIVDGAFTAQADGSLPDVIEFFERQTDPIAMIPLTTQMKLSGLRIESLVRPLGLPREARSIAARLSAEFSRDRGDFDGRHLCTASATVEDLRYDHQGLSQRMSIDAVLDANQLEVTSVRGRFADGALSGAGIVNFEQTPTGRFELSANRVNLRFAKTLLGIKDASGTGTLRLRGRIGPVITGQLDAVVDNLTANGIVVRKANFPVDWSFRPAGNVAQWQCRAGSVSVGGGNVRIASKGSYHRGLNLDASVRIENVDLAKLKNSGPAVSGILNGQALMRAKNARAVDDLVGSFALEMKNIEVMQLPVLDQLPKVISLSPKVPGRGQDGGTVRGRISGGLVHLEEVAIHQSNVQLLVTGNAAMNGKLNLEVVASTKSVSPTDPLVALLDSPLMLAAPAPVALVVKANELLKDKVVNVHVGGTADRPTLQLQPGRQLSQKAVRFFLSSSFGPGMDRLADAQSKIKRR